MSEMNYEDDEIIKIDLMKYVNPLLKHWKKIILVGLCSAVIGVAYSFTVPREFRVTTKLAPELSLRSNSLTSLASIAGINMNMLGNNNDALLPTVYPDIIASVPFITSLFDMPVGQATLFDYILNDTKSSLGKRIISLPGVAVSWVTNLVKPEAEEDTDGSVDIDTYRLTKEQHSVYKAVSKMINVNVDRKTFLVTVTVVAQDKTVAADLARNVNEKLRKYVVEYRTDKTRQVVDYLRDALATAQADYYQAQSTFAYYCDRHQNVLSQRDLVERQRLQNDVNMKFQLFSSLAQQLQQQEVQLQQETPVFAEVVPSTIPLRKYKPSRSAYLVLFFILGVIISSAVFIRNELA